MPNARRFDVYGQFADSLTVGETNVACATGGSSFPIFAQYKSFLAWSANEASQFGLLLSRYPQQGGLFAPQNVCPGELPGAEVDANQGYVPVRLPDARSLALVF